MRLTIAVLVMVGLPVVVAAQSRPMTSSPPLGVPLPLPQIGLPLPPIGLPRLSMGFPPIESPTRVEKARPLREIGNRHRRFGRKPSAPAIVYLVPAYGFRPSSAGAGRHSWLFPGRTLRIPRRKAPGWNLAA